MQMSTLSKVNESGDSVHKLTTFEREGKKKKKKVLHWESPASSFKLSCSLFVGKPSQCSTAAH